MATPRIGSTGVIEAKGDLPGFDGSNLDRLAVGANGKILIADSTQPLGMRWDFLTPSDLPTRSRFYIAGNNAWVQDGSYTVISIGQNANINISFQFPEDFGSIVACYVVCIPLQTVNNVDIDLFSQYAGIGELKNANAQSDTTSVYNLVANTFKSIDISSLFTAAMARDIAGIRVIHNGINATVEYIGVALEYNGGP
jgi:hypothetical protein